MTPPFITVLITAHSRAQFLPDAIRSVLKQSLERTRFEVIVLKNFEDQESDKLIQEHSLRSYILEATIGQALAIGLMLSDGEIICFLDDDDLFLPEKLSYVNQLFERDSRLGYVHNEMLAATSRTNELAALIGPISKRRSIVSDPMSSTSSIRRFGLHWRGFNMSSISIRKQWVLPLLGLLERIEAAQDGFFTTAALSLGVRALFDKSILTLYRYHTSMSHFVTPDLSEFATRETVHLEKYLSALDVTRMVANGTPLAEAIAFDTVYLKFRRALLDRTYGWRPRRSDVACLVTGAVKGRSNAPLYLLPLYLLSRVSPRSPQAVLRWASANPGLALPRGLGDSGSPT